MGTQVRSDLFIDFPLSGPDRPRDVTGRVLSSTSVALLIAVATYPKRGGPTVAQAARLLCMGDHGLRSVADCYVRRGLITREHDRPFRMTITRAGLKTLYALGAKRPKRKATRDDRQEGTDAA
jgi:hypothetical protein